MVIQNSVAEKLLKLHSTVAVEMISLSYIRQFIVCVLLLKSNNSIALVATEPNIFILLNFVGIEFIVTRFVNFVFVSLLVLLVAATGGSKTTVTMTTAASRDTTSVGK